MSDLPDEIWRWILEIGIQRSNLTYKDLCSLSMSCRQLHHLSNDVILWSFLLSSDFSRRTPSISCGRAYVFASCPKFAYKIMFVKRRAEKLAAYRHAVLRVKSQIIEYSTELEEIQLKLAEVTEKKKRKVKALSDLHEVRQASEALNVQQSEIMAEDTLEAKAQMKVLEVELKFCEERIALFNNIFMYKERSLEAAKERLASLKKYPLQGSTSTGSGVVE